VRPLRWTEHAVAQLESIAEYVSLSSPVYAEQLLDRIARRLDQAREFPSPAASSPNLLAPKSARSSSGHTASCIACTPIRSKFSPFFTAARNSASSVRQLLSRPPANVRCN
jgi:plasmid stabilization system protein ParE